MCAAAPLQSAEQLGAAEEQVAGSGAKTAAAEPADAEQLAETVAAETVAGSGAEQVSPWF